MSTTTVSFSDCFPDLLCAEDSGVLSADDDDESSPLSTGCSSSDFDPSAAATICRGADDDEEEVESIAGFIEEEAYFFPGFEYLARFSASDNVDGSSLDALARADSVSWILKVRAFLGFQALTAYLAVNYFDRFLCSHRLPQTNGWPLQLLSVACLSLAAKMEEPLVPTLLDLQVEGAKYIFEPKTIKRMELLVLRVLEWRLRSVTPFSYLSFFACKLDATGAFTDFLISRSSHIILSNLQDASLLEYRPSSVAAAAVLCSGSEIPNLSLAVTPDDAETWCEGLSKDKVINCYRLMQQYMVGMRSVKPSKALPQFRVVTRTRARVSSRSSSFDYSSPTSSSSYYSYSSSLSPWSLSSSAISTSTSSPLAISTSSSSPSTTSFVNKRRKLSSWSWVDVDADDDKAERSD